MPVRDDQIMRIRQCGRPGLLALWNAILTGGTPEWPSGKALEYLVLRAFELEGAAVAWPYEVRLYEEAVEQIDGAVHVPGLSCLVECKDYAKPIGIESVAKLRNQLLRRPPGVMGIVFARSDFTTPAKILAQHLAPQLIMLWDGAELEYALTNGVMVKGLLLKHRHAVEYGLPDYRLVARDIA